MPRPTTPARQHSASDQLRLMWRVAGMATLMSSEVAAGAGIGWLVDRWQGTAPRWMTIGGLVGLAIGMTGFVRSAFRLNRSMSPPPVRREPAHPHAAMDTGDRDDDDGNHV